MSQVELSLTKIIKVASFWIKKDAKEKSGGKMTLSQNLKKCLGKDLETAMHDGGLIICQLHKYMLISLDIRRRTASLD